VAVYFVESSALVKRYAQETGSAWVEVLTDPQAGHHLYVARITAVEVAAVTRRQRGGAFAAADAAAALADFADDLAHHYRQVDITSRLITQAIQLAKTYALRGYDAIQLAAVLTVHVAREAQGLSRLTLVSADRELNGAALAEGVRVDDPNIH
jgi:predicted nucleic acid-binding protein